MNFYVLTYYDRNDIIIVCITRRITHKRKLGEKNADVSQKERKGVRHRYAVQNIRRSGRLSTRQPQGRGDPVPDRYFLHRYLFSVFPYNPDLVSFRHVTVISERDAYFKPVSGQDPSSDDDQQAGRDQRRDLYD